MRSQRQLLRDRLLGRLLRDQRGALMAIVGLAIIPLFAAIGLAIDTSRAYLVKSRLWSAVDAAALAGGKAYASDTRDADIQMYFDANFPEGYMSAQLDPLQIETDDVTRTVVVSARATIPTTFMRVLGRDSITIDASSEVVVESKNVEVALVLDVTNSMAGQRIIDLRDAANELVDIVVQDIQEPFYSKVAIVPYSMGVNVGSYAAQVRGTYTNNTCTYPAPPTCRYYKFQRYSDNAWTTHEISTCVSERAGPHAYDDTPPSIAPLGKAYPPAGSYNPCLTPQIVPLTSNRSTLHQQINLLQAGGGTAGHVGVAWGWYMVSPNFGYLWPAESQPAPYDAEDLLKVVVIMTDGEYNSMYYNGVIARDSLNPGSGDNRYKINQFSHNGNTYVQAQTLCANMKAAGIIVFTVGLDVIGTPAAHNLVNQCATDPSYVYLPSDGTELKQAFRSIAMKVSTLRLSK